MNGHFELPGPPSLEIPCDPEMDELALEMMALQSDGVQGEQAGSGRLPAACMHGSTWQQPQSGLQRCSLM